MTTSDDSDLLTRSRNGDRAAFNALILRHQDRVYWVARRLVGGHDDALDITQDTFVKAWHGLADFRGDAQVFTWLYRIATNLGINHLRRARLRGWFRSTDDEDSEEVPDDSPAPDDQLERQELRQLVDEAVRALPPKQRAVFILRYYEELPYQEIATILQRSTGGLKANYFHAVRKIEEHIRHALQHQ